MPRILVHVEGQTEERFTRRILAPHLYSIGYESVGARLLGNARRRYQRGGIRPWHSVRSDILDHLRADKAAVATTMVDFYGLPDSWPGRKGAEEEEELRARAARVETALLNDVTDELGDALNPQRFIPYVVMHEFEGLLFSRPDRFAVAVGRPDLSSELQAIRDAYRTPEHINDSPDTVPSMRIRRLYSGYQKPLQGVLAAEEIGIDAMRGSCPLFDGWLRRLESMVGP